MTQKKTIKNYFKRQKAIQQKDISLIKQSIKEYKSERKANWKLFKNKMGLEIKKITKSLKILKLHSGNLQFEENLSDIKDPLISIEKGKSKTKAKIIFKEPTLTELSNTVPVTHLAK